METIICQILQMQIMKTVDIAELDITVTLTIAIEQRHKKTNVLVSGQVRHKPGCTAIEDSKRLEFSDLGRRWIVLPIKRKQRR